MDTNEVGKSYFNATLFVFMSGILLAIVVEETGLHKRIALQILKIRFLRSRSWGVMLGKLPLYSISSIVYIFMF